MGYLQNIQSFETRIETGNLQSFVEQSIKVTQNTNGVRMSISVQTGIKLSVRRFKMA